RDLTVTGVKTCALPSFGQVYVGGICAGASLALLLARRRPAIAGVAAYSMTFRYDGWAMPRLAWASSLIQLFAGLPGLRDIGFVRSAERRAGAPSHPRSA